MARKNANAKAKPEPKSKAKRQGGRPPKAKPPPSRVSRVRSTSRGGRGR